MKKVVEVLLAYQKKHNHSQSKMAELLEVSQASYNCWINGKHSIGSKHLLKISKICGIAFEALIPKDINIEFVHNGQSQPVERVNALEFYQQLTQNQQVFIQSQQARIAFLEEQLGRKGV